MKLARRWRLGIGLLFTIAGVPAAAVVLDGPPTAVDATEPLPGRWVTFEAFGNISGFEPTGDGTGVVSVSDIRWPIMALRLRGRPGRGRLSAEIRTPMNFDGHYLLAADLRSDEESTRTRVGQLLTHYRPSVALTVDEDGGVAIRPSPAVDRHQVCARRVFREALQLEMRTAEDPVVRRDAREDLASDWIERRLALREEPVSLLLRLAVLSLPADPARDVSDGLGAEMEANIRRETQTYWLGQQVRAHGRAVRLELDLLADRVSPAARLCRSIGPTRLSSRQTDRCSVEGVIDRRDGWPLTIGVSRQSEAPDGTREGHVRIFHRLAPLQGFVPPPNPCA